MSIQKIVIRGVTKNGNKFRPSDWAERLYHAIASYGPDRRPIFPTFVKVEIQQDIKCVTINPKLEDSQPLLFDFLISFAKDNDLDIVDGEGNTINSI